MNTQKVLSKGEPDKIKSDTAIDYKTSVPKEVFTVVAFRYDQKRSVLYRTVTNIDTVSDLIQLALRRFGADVISVRRVYSKRPIPQNQT